MRAVAAVLSLALLAAPAAKDDGVLCLAPFRAERVPGSPPMSQTTWPPSPGSKFIFRVDRRIKQTVAEDQSIQIRGVPANRKVLVQVELDGRPFESFRVDLRKEPDHRLCLRLDRGYWHWIEGCRCGKRP